MARIHVKKGETLIGAISRAKHERIQEIVSDAAIASAKTCEAAILAERERCAKIAESQYADSGWHGFYRTAGSVIAAAIRNEE